MKYHSKYSLEDSVWGVGLQYLEYDMATGEVVRQVEDYGNILLYCQVDTGQQTVSGTCQPAEVSLALEHEYDEDRVLESVFAAKWARATQFFDPRLDAANPCELTAGDVEELKAKFNANGLST
jgi:hypothetical protein